MHTHTHTHKNMNRRWCTSYRTSSQVSIKNHCNRKNTFKKHEKPIHKKRKEKDNTHATKVLALLEIKCKIAEMMISFII